MGETERRVKFSVLSPGQIEEVHARTLDVLNDIGVKVPSDSAIAIFRHAGCRVDGQLVKVPPHLVTMAIDRAPKGLTLYDREGRPCMEVEGDNLYFGTGPTTSFTLDILSGERRPTLASDVELHARVADALRNIDFVMPLGSVSDATPGASDLHEFIATVKNTGKPVPFITWNRANLDVIVQMAAAIAGGAEVLRERPFILPFTQPVSPLQHDAAAVEILIRSADLGLPVAHYSAISMGGTGPMSIYGSTIQGNAEVLSGLVLTQLRREGTPFVVGISAMPLNMRTGAIIYGSPEYLLAMAAHTEVCKSYGLPTWGTAGLTDAKTIDEQAAMESTLCTFMAALSGANMIHDCGYMESCLTGSAEMVVMQDEVIGFVKRIMAGVDGEVGVQLVNLIAAAGPGGNFLETDHTLHHFRDVWSPEMFDRLSYSTWEERGRKDYRMRLNERTRTIASEHNPQPLPAEVSRELDRLLERRLLEINEV